MIRRRLLAALPLLFALAAPPAWAGEDAKKPPAEPFIELQPVAMPVIADGQLINYVFVNVRLNLLPGADVPRWRQKEPFFRDALVRAGHEAPFTLAGDYNKIDAAKLCAVLMRSVVAMTGPGVVRSVAVTKQVPMHMVGARPRA